MTLYGFPCKNGLILYIPHFLESLKFNLPYTSLYTRASKKVGLPFSTSCVHSPMPRIPSPYLRRNASEVTPRPTKSYGGLSSLHQDNLKSGKQMSPKSPARSQVAQIQPTKGRSNGEFIVGTCVNTDSSHSTFTLLAAKCI